MHRREVVRLQQIEQPDILLAIDIGIDLFHWLLYFREYVHDRGYKQQIISLYKCFRYKGDTNCRYPDNGIGKLLDTGGIWFD